MKIEIEVTDPADVNAIMNLLAGKGEWPGKPVAHSEASEGERVEKHAAQQEAPKKRGPGRPRMTDEEKAEAAKKRAAEKAAKERAEAEAKAAKAAKEAEEDDSAEEPEPTTEDDLEKDTGKAAALDDEDDSDDDSDKDPMEEAVELATKYLRDGNGKEVRRALKSVGASRVSDLKGAKVQEFLEIIKSI